jgi:signal transduction histidine kinase/CheY-like chemotaxis protein
MSNVESSSAPASASRRHRAVDRWRAAIVLVLLLPLIGLGAAAAWMFQQQFEDTRSRLDRSARIVQEHALKLLDTNEMLLQRLLDLLGDDNDEQLLQRSASLHERMKSMAETLPQVQGLFVNGADSRMLASSRFFPPIRELDFSDRAWFKAQSQVGGSGLFVSELLRSRANGEAAFDMSRRRVAADGRFAGTVHVSLRPEYLIDFYKELGAAERGLRIGMLRTDGAIIARWPGALEPGMKLPDDDPLIKQVAAGSEEGGSEGASPFDGSQRLRSFRRLGDYPLLVSAAMDRSVVIASWRDRVLRIALFVVPASLACAWGGWLALRRTRSEIDAHRQLDEETARRQRAEVALLQSQKQDAISNLTGGVAHEFNNLLMVINSNAEVLRRRQPELLASPQLQAIGRAVDNGSRLTRQLLAFARKQALSPERMALQERLPDVIDLMRPLLGSGIVLQSGVEAATAPVHVDAAEFELALINLAINARDAMSGKGQITIRARNAVQSELPSHLQGQGAFVRIDVEDTGNGFAGAVAARAFEPFFTTKPAGSGTGLGLAQVRAMCHAAGGEARIDSLPGAGARISLFLARSREDAAPPATAAAQMLPACGCLLLVEDNVEVARATRMLLESMGCLVLHANGAQQALQMIDSHPTPIDVVLSDVEMPGEIDGIALAQRLAQRQPPIPAVLMTGYASRLEQAELQRLDVLSKPCSAQALTQAIAKALTRRHFPPSPTLVQEGSR